jgi:single-stranded DNA-binding protein
MTVYTMISGTMVGEARSFPTKTGGKLTSFKLKVTSGATLEWWDVVTFSDTAREELEGVGEGDAISATGEMRIEPWERDGRRGLNFKLTADRVLALKPKPKPKAKATATPQPESAPRRGTTPIDRAAVARHLAAGPRQSMGGNDLDDSIPF